MPRERRPSSSVPRGDNRPAFARPPGASRAAPRAERLPSSPSPRRNSKHRVRTRDAEVEDYEEHEVAQEEDSFEDVSESDLPFTPQRHQKPRHVHKSKESPAPSPEKERRSRQARGHSSSHPHGRSRESEGRPRDRNREREREREREGHRSRDLDQDRQRHRDSEPRRQHKRKISEPVKQSPRAERERDRDRAKYNSGTSTGTTSQILSLDSLAKLNANNERILFEERRLEQKRREKEEKQKKKYKDLKGASSKENGKRRDRKGRQVSGAIMEEGRVGGRVKRRGGGSGHVYDEYEDDAWDEKHDTRHRNGGRGGGGGTGGGLVGKWKSWSRKRKILIIVGLSLVLLLLIIIIAVVASKSKSGKSGAKSSGSDSSVSVQNSCDASGVPTSAKGTYTDISTWLDTTDFNCTYTAETVGNLSVMGLSSSWDDSKKANPNVPALNQEWKYGEMPIRGTNLGGWLDLEPFITPSMFKYSASDNVVDEWTLCKRLGTSAPRMLENHYATFITKQDFADIAAAGLDHVRIPYPYWAVRVYDGDPYVPQIAWRYLLRGIEYARENGLRVNLDLHSAPGSQNGWAHSGHQGSINWLIGNDGTQNGQRTLDIHDQLSKFFAQDRYSNVVTIYGLVNEPKMLVIPHEAVLDWNKQAISVIRGNGIKQYLVFGDGFLALDDWDDMFKGADPNLMMDTHQYQIFNTGQLKLKHQDKINLACTGWAGMLAAVNNPSTGWGPTINGEFSQADTDCTPNLNNVGVGSRWAGTLNTGDPSTSVLTQTCPSPPCSCDQANADPSSYSSSYKQFLKMFAESQMYAFEQAWGWFYWTWKTESAVQWSWKLGLDAGILPAKAYQPDFKCDSSVPDFSGLSEGY